MTSSRRWIAPALDLLAIVLFVAIGRENHSISWNLTWFFTVWWPLTLSWVVGALVTRLYVRDDRIWSRLAGTIVVAVGVGGILRWAFTGRVAYSIFTVVALSFLTLVTFGWRLVGLGVGRLRARTAPAG
jgi:hypothetical protein